jgi:hypothetical protein
VNEQPTTPAEVWKLIERADELVKYASNRDPAAAYAQARETLERAMAAAREVAGAQPLVTQVERRLDDIAALEARGT